MKWNAFDLISPAFEKAKERMSPFNFKEWLRIGFVGSLAGVSNYSGTFSSGSSSSSSEGSKLTLEQFRQSTIETFQKYGGLIGIFLSIFLLFSFILTYICSVFSFVFIDLLVDKKAKINFSKQSSKGVSLLLFRVVFSSIFFLILAALASPYVYYFFLGNPVLSSVGQGYVVFSILALIVSFFLIWFSTLFVNDLVTTHMYSKENSVWSSWKEVWNLIFDNKKETFVYWLGRFVISLASGIILGIVLLTLIIVELFILGLVFLIGYLFYLLIGLQLFFIILVGVISVILIVANILIIIALYGPVLSFIRYFQLLNFEKLSGINLIAVKGGKNGKK